MQIWPRNMETERSSINHIVDMINIRCSPLKTNSFHVMIGYDLVEFGLRDHLED